MIVYNSDLALCNFNEDSKLLETSWIIQPSVMTITQAKHEFLETLKVIANLKPRYILADTLNFTIKVDPELQSWIVLKFIGEIKEHMVLKYAILVTTETFKNVSNELMSDFPDDDFEIQYFTNKEKALNWMNVK